MLNILKKKKKYTPTFQQIDNKSVASHTHTHKTKQNKTKTKTMKEIQEINNSVPS